MPLTYPMRALPGELLVTTENEEDVAYNELWRVPDTFDGFDLCYGDLMLVLATSDCGCGMCADPVKPDEFCSAPTWVLHCRTERVIRFDDITEVAWVWRPDPSASEWRRDQPAASAVVSGHE